MTEKQSVRKGLLYIGGEKRYRKQGGKKRYRKQTGKGFPIRLLASAAAQILGEVAKPIF